MICGCPKEVSENALNSKLARFDKNWAFLGKVNFREMYAVAHSRATEADEADFGCIVAHGNCR